MITLTEAEIKTVLTMMGSSLKTGVEFTQAKSNLEAILGKILPEMDSLC